MEYMEHKQVKVADVEYSPGQGSSEGLPEVVVHLSFEPTPNKYFEKSMRESIQGARKSNRLNYENVELMENGTLHLNFLVDRSVKERCKDVLGMVKAWLKKANEYSEYCVNSQQRDADTAFQGCLEISEVVQKEFFAVPTSVVEEK